MRGKCYFWFVLLLQEFLLGIDQYRYQNAFRVALKVFFRGPNKVIALALVMVGFNFGIFF